MVFLVDTYSVRRGNPRLTARYWVVMVDGSVSVDAQPSNWVAAWNMLPPAD